MKLQDIRDLISQGETQDAIKAMMGLLTEGVVHNKRLQNDLIILSGRFESIKHKEILGIMEQEDITREHAQVNNSLLSLIAEIEEQRPPEGSVGDRISSQTGGLSKHQKLWLISGAVVSLVLLLGYFLWPPGTTKEPTKTEIVEMVQAGFHWNCIPPACLAPCDIQFNNDSKNAESYLWNFGDQQTSVEQNPRHTYVKAGSYTVKLIAKKGNSSDQYQMDIRILPTATAAKSAALKELIFRLNLYNDLLDQHERTMNNEHALQLDSWYNGWHTNSDKSFEGKGMLYLISQVRDERPNVHWDALERSLKSIHEIVQQRTGERQFGVVQTMYYPGLARNHAVMKQVVREIG